MIEIGSLIDNKVNRNLTQTSNQQVQKEKTELTFHNDMKKN